MRKIKATPADPSADARAVLRLLRYAEAEVDRLFRDDVGNTALRLSILRLQELLDAAGTE